MGSIVAAGSASVEADYDNGTALLCSRRPRQRGKDTAGGVACEAREEA